MLKFMQLSIMLILLGMISVLQAKSLYSGTETLQISHHETQFVIRLAANPTTGYQWTLIKYDKKLLTNVAAHYQRPHSNLIGAGGQMVYVFKINQNMKLPHSTRLSFQYGRPWESHTKGNEKQVIVRFK